MASIRNPRLQVELCCSRNIIYRSLVTASVSFSSLVGADGSTFTICIPAISKEIRARVSISHVIRSRRARTIFCRPSIKEPVTSSGRVRNLFAPSDRDPHEQSCWSLRIRGMSVCPTWCPWRCPCSPQFAKKWTVHRLQEIPFKFIFLSQPIFYHNFDETLAFVTDFPVESGHNVTGRVFHQGLVNDAFIVVRALLLPQSAGSSRSERSRMSWKLHPRTSAVPQQNVASRSRQIQRVLFVEHGNRMKQKKTVMKHIRQQTIESQQ